ncbi:MAG: ABC transporter permease [Planctomycetota bacterium]
MGKGLHATRALAMRELLRVVRQPLRIAVAIATPVMVWLLFAGGFANGLRSDAVPGESFALYLLPGMASLVVLFNAVFASISLIEDRHSGLLQAVLASPAPRWSVVWGKLLGGGATGFAQAVVLLAGAPLLGADLSAVGVLSIATGLAFLSFGITGLGLAAAWFVDSTAGFHGIMNLVFMPMWLLSGSVFPVDGSSAWMRIVAGANPIAWCQRATRTGLDGGVDGGALLASLAFAAVAVLLAALVMRRRS